MISQLSDDSESFIINDDIHSSEEFFSEQSSHQVKNKVISNYVLILIFLFVIVRIPYALQYTLVLKIEELEIA